MEEKRIRRCAYAMPDIVFAKETIKITCQIDEKEITEHDCETCPKYRSRYIEYPIEVSSIELADGVNLYKNSVGRIVRIKPCLEETEGKEYLGIFLGEMFSFNAVSYKRQEKHLVINPVLNPAIYIPELKRIVYGYESWWSFMEDEEETQHILGQLMKAFDEKKEP